MPVRKFLLSLLLALGIGCGSLAYAGSRFEAYAWQEACELSRYSCEGVARPVVEYDKVALKRGMLGYYMIGTRVVFIALGQPADQEYAVLVHEMVHYLQFMHAERRDVVLTDHCAAEREAFEVSDQVVKRLGRPELARNGDLSDYGCNGTGTGR